MIVALDKTL